MIKSITQKTITKLVHNLNSFRISCIKPIKQLACLLILLFSSMGWGQSATNYTFSASSGTYTTLSGATSITPSDIDDGFFNGIPIGFNFVMNGTTFTHAHVSTNGWMTLGTSSSNNTISSSTASNSLTSLANSPTIAPLWDDIALSSINGISYLLSGSSPNRVLTIQYNNVKWRYDATSAVLSFQVNFYETSNSINFIYNPEAGNTVSPSASIGIATSSSNYLSLGTTVTTSATVSSSSSTTNITTKPASGITFTFTPPPPCAAPTSLAATASSSSQTISTISGSFTAASTAPSGYIVVRSTSATPPAPLAATALPTVGNTSTFGTGTYVEYVNSSPGSWISTGLIGNTTYYYYVFSYNNTSCIGGPLYSSSATTFSQSTPTCPPFSSTIIIGGTTTPGSSYATLTAAIADIQACGITQPTILELSASYTSTSETFPITLRSITGTSATNTITIRPASDAVGEVITSSNTTATIDINGGQFWIIDGRPGGVGSSQLTISSTSTSTGGSAIRLINEASNNIVRYASLSALFPSTSSGVIFFSTTSGANGNDNNTIEYCNIDGGAGTTTSPTLTALNGIYSSGTTASTATNNSGNTISNCNIFNFFGAAATSAGLSIQSGSSDWIITGNSIYQTNTRTTTAGSTYIYGITIAGGGNNFIVTNNFIGGSTSNAGGSPWTISGNFSNRFNGIGLSVGTTTASSVQGNTIANIIFTSTSSASANSTSSPLGTGFWGGIMIAAGNANVGTVSGNTIGASTGTGSIQATCQTTGGTANGIGVSGSGIVNISNNNIGSITSLGSTTSISSGIIGIQSASTGTVTVNSNIIGSASTANSLNASNASTNSTGQLVVGINNSGAATAISITNNTIANLNNGYVPSTAYTTNSVLRGIVSSAGTNIISGNTMRNLTTAANATGTTSAASVIGISMTSTTAPSVVSQNTIYALSNTNSGAVATGVIGIHYNGPTTGTNLVARNFIYGLSSSGTSATGFNYGINISGGLTNYQNNMIVVGQGNNIGMDVRGINDLVGTTNNYYNNTVYVGGAPSTNAANSFAFNSAVTTNTRAFQNNIFVNARSNGSSTGKHYAVSLAGTAANPAGLTSNYNIYQATGLGGVLGLFNATDRTSLALWQTATGQDANSKNASPCLVNPTAATPDLHLSDCSGAGNPAEASGITIASVTDDFDGQTRSTLTPVDIGADAGNFGPTGIDMRAASLVSPTLTSCKTATETVAVSITNLSTNAIDFSVNNVTVSVTATGGYSSSVILSSGTLAAGSSQTVTMPVTIDLTVSGNYIFNANTSVTGDLNASNDAMTATNIVLSSLGGIYTVGTSGNYSTLPLAISAVNNATCITAPIVLSLLDASYNLNSTPLVINNNANLTSTNTLTIKPATGVTSTITGSVASGALIVLNGADFVTIDGSNSGGTDKSLTISNTSTTNASGIFISSLGSGTGATNNTIKNCTINVNSSLSQQTTGISVAGANINSIGADNDNTIIQNNTINSPGIGIYAMGTTSSSTGGLDNVIISGNSIFTGSSSASTVYGLEFANAINLSVISNTFNLLTSATTAPVAISLETGVSNSNVSNNNITSCVVTATNGYGGRGITIGTGSTSSNITVSNNFIAGVNGSNFSAYGNSSSVGIMIGVVGNSSTLTNSTGGVNLYNNTVNMSGNYSYAAGCLTTALYIGSGATSLDIRNNIFVNSLNNTNGSGTTSKNYAIYSVAPNTAFTNINYNNYSVSGTQGMLGFLTSDNTTLANLTTAFGANANSLNIAPTFISATDLHLNTSLNCQLDNKGVFIATVTTDIDGANRSNSTPDMGADEFTGASVATTWTGATNNFWSVATNWSCGVVPTATDAISIASGTPTLDVDFSEGVTGTLTISGTGTLTIAPGKVLTIAGTANFGGKAVIFKSDATGTAMLGPLTGSLTNATNVKVERYIPSGKRAFRLLSPAVTTTTFISGNWQQQTHITGGASGGFDVTETNNPSMFTYDNLVATGSGWTPIANTNATNLTAGVGYRMLVRGDRTATNITAATTDNMNAAITLSATGTLRTGTVALNASSTPAINNTANTTTADYSLVGNPYQSAVDWNAVTKSGIDATYYAWDPNMGTTGVQRGRYVVFNGTTNDNVSSQVGQFIQPGQAFFVKNTVSGTAGTLTFQEAHKATTNANVFRTANQTESTNLASLSMQLYDPNELAIGGYPIDATKAVFGAEYTNELGLGDATKLEAAGENIAWFRNNTKLAIDAAAPVTTSDELVLKTLRLGANKNYTFKIQTTNFDTTLTPYLVDTFLNTQTEIATSQAFLASFATTSNMTSYSENRFKIVFQNALLNTDAFAAQVGLYPNPSKGNGFYLQLPSTAQATVRLFNTLGQEIAISHNEGHYQAKQSLSAGVYHIMVTQGEKTSKLKWIVE